MLCKTFFIIRIYIKSNEVLNIFKINHYFNYKSGVLQKKNQNLFFFNCAFFLCLGFNIVKCLIEFPNFLIWVV